MLFAELPQRGWEAYWYTSLDEFADPDKALVKWLRAVRMPREAAARRWGTR